jgi:cyclophilin family peptidyl-prolyl cis-trans isomerase
MRSATVFLVLLGLAAASCGGSGGSGSGDRSARNLTHCEHAQPELKEEGKRKPPEHPLDPKKRYEAFVETSCGEFTITVEPRLAPNATASFVDLAKDGFYDGIAFHRVAPGFVIQGGDPTGTGTGGPGYQTTDAVPSFVSYTRGVVAMAKTLDQGPGTAGSEFFVVTAKNAGLPPAYAVIGRVTAGFATIRRIGRLGDANTQQPRRPVVIRGIVVRETKLS